MHYKADHPTEKGGEGVRDRLTELPKDVSMFDILYADDGRIKRWVDGIRASTMCWRTMKGGTK